ncbi:MAG: sugar ABC transporter substrate-binding protein [Bacteroidetes bacterium]|nr:MAG: sugar ABC transporter substrate-binding protein [Bacteroidota bacterium]
MKKSIALLLLTIFLLSFTTFIFAGGEKETAGTEPVKLEFWTRETQSDRMATIQILIDTYIAMNPDISIKLVPVDENDMALNMRAAAAAGTMPSIIEIDAEIAVALGAEGILDTAAASSLLDRVGKDKFYNGALRLFESKDKGAYYGVPYHGMVQGIWYRADWFEEAGLQPPTTWDAVAKAAEYFYKPEENMYGLLLGTMETESYDEQCFTPIAMSNNAGLFDKDGNLVFNSPEMKEAVEFYARLAKTTPPGPQTWRARDYYLQGKMAMFFYSTYIMDDLSILEVAQGSLTSDNFEGLKGAEFDPDLVKNTKIATILSNKKDAGFGAVVSMALPKQSDPAVTAAAVDFLNYLYSPNAYITFLHMAVGGMMPVFKGVAETDRFLNDPKGVYSKYGAEKIGEITEGLNYIETFGIVEGNRIEAASTIYSKKIIPQMIYKITQEGMDVDKAMAWAESEMKKLLN